MKKSCARVVLDVATTIKEFARKHGITYEATRQQVRRYADELEGHIKKNGRTMVLDEWAEDFLAQKREDNPLVVAQMDLQRQIQDLQNENKALVIKLATQATQLAGAYQQVAEIQRQLLELPATQQKELQEAQLEARATQQQLLTTQQQLQEAQQEADRLRAELDAERKKGFLQRLFSR